jgi:hypothetical protein
MEERAGERRNLRPPLSSVLSPILRRGERKKKRSKILREMTHFYG